MPVLDGISAAEQVVTERIAPVVILTAFSQRDLVERAREAGAMAYLVKPFQKKDLLPTIEMAVSRFAELVALEGEVADLTGRLEARKLVDRAKGVLQTEHGLTEPEAFRWIQRTSMDRRLSMRQVAERRSSVRTGRHCLEGPPGARRSVVAAAAAAIGILSALSGCSWAAKPGASLASSRCSSAPWSPPHGRLAYLTGRARRHHARGQGGQRRRRRLGAAPIRRVEGNSGDAYWSVASQTVDREPARKVTAIVGGDRARR